MRARRDAFAWSVVGLLGLGVALHVLFVARYGVGHWIEQDTALMATVTTRSAASGSLGTVADVYSYSWGSGCQAILLALQGATGLDVATLQLVALPIVGAVFLAIAYPFLRHATTSRLQAALALAILAVQADVLFTTSRGTHEKFTFSLMAATLLIFLIVADPARGRERKPLALLAALLMAGLATMNFFFAGLFIVLAVTAALLDRALGVAGNDRGARADALLVGALSVGLIAVFVYKPARLVVVFFVAAFRTLLFGRSDLGASIAEGLPTWRSPAILVAMYAFTLIVALLSFVGFVLAARLGSKGAARVPRVATLFLALAPVTAICLALDVLGFLGANLTLRSLPILTLVAAPYAAFALERGAIRWRVASSSAPAAAFAVAGLLLVAGSVAVLRATSDPALSHKWILWRDTEQAAVVFDGEHHLDGRTWADVDERLRVLSDLHFGEFLWLEGASKDAPHALLTSLDEARAKEFPERGPPALPNAMTVYDNGDARLVTAGPP